MSSPLTLPRRGSFFVFFLWELRDKERGLLERDVFCRLARSSVWWQVPFFGVCTRFRDFSVLSRGVVVVIVVVVVVVFVVVVYVD